MIARKLITLELTLSTFWNTYNTFIVEGKSYIHHLPSIDHTIGNESGMYIEIYNIGVLTVNIELNMW
jgi:hypothetical protein